MAISPESKMLSPDRVLILSLIDGKAPKSSMGLTDPRLFNGDNKVHVLTEPQTNLWYFKYEQGAVPEPLKCKFTSFRHAYNHAKDYFNRRNIEIKEVIA